MMTPSHRDPTSPRQSIWPIVLCGLINLLLIIAMAARLVWGAAVGLITAVALVVGTVMVLGIGASLLRRSARQWIVRHRVKIAIPVTAFGISLALAEGALRVMDPTLESVLEPDATLGWAPKRNVLTYQRDPDTGELRRITTDQHGFRSAPLRADSRKIAVVGDSMTFGLMADQDVIAPTLLAERLGARYQVINASAGGWGTDQELLFFRQRVVPLRPEVVLWVVSPSNDVNNNMIDHMLFWRETPKPYFTLDGDDLAFHPISGDRRLVNATATPFYSIHLVKLVRRAVGYYRLGTLGADARERAGYPEDLDHDYSHYCILLNEPTPGFRRGMSLTAALLAEARRTAEQAGMTIHFVAFDPFTGRAGMPDLRGASKRYGWDPNRISLDAGRRNLLTIAREANIDLHLYTPPIGSRFESDAHLSPRGHAYFADFLHRVLRGEIRPARLASQSAARPPDRHGHRAIDPGRIESSEQESL